MISVLAVVLSLQLLLTASGLALLQFVNYGERIRILPLIPFAWGAGVVLLYLGGKLFVETEWLPHGWHLAIVSGMVALTVAGIVVYFRGRTCNGEAAPDFSASIHWYDAVIIALILVKVGVVTYICLINPVIDSDATYMRGYVALAKKIKEGVTLSEVFGRSYGLGSPVGPALLSAWPNTFMSRWYNGATFLPWALAWVFSGCAAFVVCHKLTRRFTASLACAYLFLSVPLGAIHVFRTGFHDLLTMYFFILAVGAVSIAFLSEQKIHRTWAVIGGIALLGTMLCKTEGKMWGLLLGVMWLNYYLHEHRGIPWKRLISVQALLLISLVLIHRFGLSEEFFEGLGEPRLGLMAAHAFDEKAFRATWRAMLVDGSFGIWWWGVILTGIYLLAKDFRENVKVVALFALFLPLSVVYFANFTANVVFTVSGTNVSRFLLHVLGVWLPLYCALIMTWLPSRASVTEELRTKSGNDGASRNG